MAAKLTRTQRKILALLEDGLPHSRREIHGLLYDSCDPLANIQPHISALRKKLPKRQAILCEWHRRGFCYRLVGLLAKAR